MVSLRPEPSRCWHRRAGLSGFYFTETIKRWRNHWNYFHLKQYWQRLHICHSRKQFLELLLRNWQPSCREMWFWSDDIFGWKDDCQHSHLCHGNICRGFMGIWILRETGCRSERNRLKQPKDRGSDLKYHSGRIVCSLSTSHRRNGTELSRRLSLFDLRVIVSNNNTISAARNAQDTPNMWSTTFGVYQ